MLLGEDVARDSHLRQLQPSTVPRQDYQGAYVAVIMKTTLKLDLGLPYRSSRETAARPNVRAPVSVHVASSTSTFGSCVSNSENPRPVPTGLVERALRPAGPSRRAGCGPRHLGP